MPGLQSDNGSGSDSDKEPADAADFSGRQAQASGPAECRVWQLSPSSLQTHTDSSFPKPEETNTVNYTNLIPDLPESWVNYTGAAPFLETEDGYASA